MRAWRPSEPTGVPTDSRVVRARFDTAEEREALARAVDIMRDPCCSAREVGAAINVVKSGARIMVNVEIVERSQESIRGLVDVAREVEVRFFDYSHGLRLRTQKMTGFDAECVQVAMA